MAASGGVRLGRCRLVETAGCPRRASVRPNQNFQAWNPEIDRGEKSWLSVPTEPVAGTGQRLPCRCVFVRCEREPRPVPRRGAGDQALRVPVRDPCRSAWGRQPTKRPGSASWTTDRAQQPSLACGFRCLDSIHHLAGRHRGPNAHMALEGPPRPRKAASRKRRSAMGPQRLFPALGQLGTVAGWLEPLLVRRTDTRAGERGRHSTTWRALALRWWRKDPLMVPGRTETVTVVS